MHMEDAAKYGCSGLLGIHWRTGATEPQIQAMGAKSWTPTLTAEAFWRDWARWVCLLGQGRDARQRKPETTGDGGSHTEDSAHLSGARDVILQRSVWSRGKWLGG